MKIQELMTSNPITVDVNTTIDAAARLMADNDIGFLPVEQAGQLKGVITDRDITVRAVAKQRDPKMTMVGDVMTPKVYACYDDQDVNEVAKEMEQRQVRRVVVFDRQNRTVGIMSLGDVVEHGAKKAAAEILEKVSAPVHSMRQK